MEGPGIIVVLLDIAVDCGLEIYNGSEDTAFETSAGERGEEALDGVEPGTGCWREVEEPANRLYHFDIYPMARILFFRAPRRRLSYSLPD